LGFYASQISLLIDAVRLLRQEQRARRLAETLLQVPHAARQTVDQGQELENPGATGLREDLRRLMSLLCAVIDYRTASVTLLEGAKLSIFASLGELGAEAGDLLWDAADDPKVANTIATGRPLMVSDTRADPHWRRIPGTEYIQSWIGAPIWTPDTRRLGRQNLLGILNIDGDKVGAFDQSDVAVAQAFADQMAIVIENHRLYQSMIRRIAELALLNQMTAAINSAMNLADLLNLILGQLRQLVAFGRASVTLLDGDELLVIGAAGFPADVNIVGHRFPWGQFAINRKVVETRKPISIPDVRTDSRWVTTDTTGSIRSWLGAPLAYGGRIVGLLTLTSSEPHHYTHEEEQLVAAVAEQAALAIEKAWLLEEMHSHLATAEQKSQELALVNQISNQLGASLDLATVLQTTVEQTAHALHMAQSGVVLFDWEAGYGRLVARFGEETAAGVADQIVPVAGNASLARVLETRQALAIRSSRTDPLLAHDRDLIIRHGICSTMMLPLMVRGEVMGTVVLNELAAEREFTPAEIELAQTIANQAAAAIANARLYEDIKRRAVQLQTIQEVTGRINAILDPHELLMQVSDLLVERCDYYHAQVFVLDGAGDYLVAAGGSGSAGRQCVDGGLRLAVGSDGICGWVAATNTTAMVNDVEADQRYLPHRALVGTRSEMVAPMRLAGKCIGVLDVHSNRIGAFDQADRFLIETLADQVAIALENARLYAALQERAAQLAAAYEDLKELDRMKDEFVQTVSHELRTPLTFVKGYVELMLEGVLGSLNPEQKEALDIVLLRTENVVRLVNDIIAMTRADSVELSLQSVDLGIVALNCVRAAQAVGEQSGIMLQTDIAPDLPPVHGDQQRLAQVFDNLIGNAIKFSPRGGAITVRLHREGPFAWAEICDQGIGIPAEQLHRVWERFYQVEAGTTRRFGGTGLGLAIVKRLVEAHGGDVGATSVLGAGSTFYFTVPLADAGRGAIIRDES